MRCRLLNFGVLTVVSTLALVACSEPQVVNANSPEIRPVLLVQVRSGTPQQVRRFPGAVEATQSANLTFRVPGELIELSTRPGQAINAGEVIAKVDPTDYALNVAQTQARAELAKAQFSRAARLLTDGIVSQADYEQAQAEQQMAIASLNTAKANLSYTELRAPFSGVVAALHVEPFENIAPQQPIVTLQTDSLIDVVIQVPERLFARVHRDDSYQPNIRFDSIPDQVFLGRVREWDRIADPATNTYRVVFSLTKPENVNILPGMTAQVFIDSGRLLTHNSSTVTLPVSAVFSPPELTNSNTERYVWVYKETSTEQGQVHLRQVRLGDASTAEVVVVDGLEAGEWVVSAGVHQLKDQMLVRPWHRERGL